MRRISNIIIFNNSLKYYCYTILCAVHSNLTQTSFTGTILAFSTICRDTSNGSLVGFGFYSARNARFARAVLATAIPSVRQSVCPSVRLSVTRRYCVKTTARSTVQFALSDRKMCLVL